MEHFEENAIVDTSQPADGVGQKEIRLTMDELHKIADEAAKKAVERQNRAEQRRAEQRSRGLLYNVKVLLENYTKFKHFISESVQSLEDIEHEQEAEVLDDEMLKIFGLSKNDTRINSISKSVAKMTVLMAHVDRMLEVYRVSCEGSPSITVRRRWGVIERMYLRDKRMTTNQIADEYHLEPRNIREDAKLAREDLKVLLFGIEAIIVDLT